MSWRNLGSLSLVREQWKAFHFTLSPAVPACPLCLLRIERTSSSTEAYAAMTILMRIRGDQHSSPRAAATSLKATMPMIYKAAPPALPEHAVSQCGPWQSLNCQEPH